MIIGLALGNKKNILGKRADRQMGRNLPKRERFQQGPKARRAVKHLILLNGPLIPVYVSNRNKITNINVRNVITKAPLFCSTVSNHNVGA